MTDHKFQNLLAALCQRHFGKGKGKGKGEDKVQSLMRLSGGANMESWAFIFGNREMILRRLPEGLRPDAHVPATKDLATKDLATKDLATKDSENNAAISLSTQADLIELARKRGVSVPIILVRLHEEDQLGQGFVMNKVKGEALPHRILGKPDFARATAKLAQQCARELAAIHAIALVNLPCEVKTVTASQLLAQQEKIYYDSNAQIAVYDYGLTWLRNHLPENVEPRLVHGDFRMGNLMLDADGITAVLDWELAHCGDPIEDLAWLCTPSWRFGHYQMEAGGFDTADNLIAAYQRQTGQKINRSRFDWWLIYNTLWWGICCLRMGESYRNGTAHTLERTVIGRRVSEVEIDLLLLCEPMRDKNSPKLDWMPPTTKTTKGQTTYSEILQALGEWNNEKIMPHARDHGLFEARVANNALGIAQRQAEWGQIYAQRQKQRLAELGTTAAQLCNDLRAKNDLNDDKTWKHLQLTALERLSIDQPRYAGLEAAIKKWR